jgi:hypothetical protein
MQKAMQLWMMDPAERDAVLLYECTKPGGTKGDHALLGILCTRNSAQLYLIKQAYYTMFNETLENHIDGCDTSIAADFQNKVCCGSLIGCLKFLLLKLFVTIFGLHYYTPTKMSNLEVIYLSSSTEAQE